MLTKFRTPKIKATSQALTDRQLTEDEKMALREFVFWAVGDGYLTSWESRFLDTIKQKLYGPVVYLSEKQSKIIDQIKDKLHYNTPDDPLPPIDPDGIVENTDPDGFVDDDKQTSPDPNILFDDEDFSNIT